MATLESLLEQKRDLEDRLCNGDASAEVALDRVDRAIMARKKQISHSQQCVAAVKTAVAAGVPKEQAKKGKAKKSARPNDQTINRFE
jgi:hypothetical protein